MYILLNFDFLFLVDVDVDDYLVFVGEVIGLPDVYLGILEALLLEMFLDDGGGTVDNVGGNLVTLHQPQTHLQIFALALLEAVVIDLRDTRLLLELNFDPRLVAIGLGQLDDHVGEEALPPEFLGSIGNGVTGNLDYLSHLEPRVTDEHIVLVVGCTGHGNTGNFVFLRNSRVDNFGVVYRVELLFILCGCRP